MANMNTQKRLIPKGTRDPGSAQMVANVRKRLQKLEAKAGVIGSGAVLTGPTVTTSNDAPFVLIQGAGGQLLPAQGEGLYVANDDGGIVISIQPNQGLTMADGEAEDNTVTWRNASGEFVAGIYGYNPAPAANLMLYTNDSSVQIVDGGGEIADQIILNAGAVTAVVQGANGSEAGGDGDGEGLTVSGGAIFGSGDVQGQRHVFNNGLALWSDSGAPANSVGANGDIYFRSDGASGTAIYQKRSGSWVAIA